MLTGTIQSLRPEKGFGFIRPDDESTDVFFHRSSVQGELTSLFEGQRVDYELDATADRPRATSVVARGDRGLARRDRPAGRRAERIAQPPALECRRGFVTKLRRDETHGFISADEGGTEVRFEPSTVVGEKRFLDLIIGDYVEFAVIQETIGTKTPTAYYVREIERKHQFPQTQLSRHPKSRRKKPTWR